MPRPPAPSRTGATFAPPIPAARRWLEGVEFPAHRPLINVSQAAPVAPPPQALRAEMARLVCEDPTVHIYGAVLGLPALRAQVAEQFSHAYGGTIEASQVGITSGCNEAFAAVMSCLTDQNSEVLVPLPWYFNHKMWLDMAGVRVVPLPCTPDLLPDLAAARQLITPATRAIVMVTPNNPTGVEYPPALLAGFAALAREAGGYLVVDETYRDFHSQTGAPHGLFHNAQWPDHLVQLYSFSKAYRLTGHRVGAVVADAGLLREIEKFLDTVTICPTPLGQQAALWGMTHLQSWLAEERAEVLARRAAIESGFAPLAAKGWRLLGCGAYFAYVEHPFDMDADTLGQRLVREAGILALPATMFTPEGDKAGRRQLRIAFANIDCATIAQMFDRLSAFEG